MATSYRGDQLINLQLVEAEKEEGFRAGLPQHGAPDDKVKRTPILYGDLFKVEEGKKSVRKLIVEGNAGIGKPTASDEATCTTALQSTHGTDQHTTGERCHLLIIDKIRSYITHSLWFTIWCH